MAPQGPNKWMGEEPECPGSRPGHPITSARRQKFRVTMPTQTEWHRAVIRTYAANATEHASIPHLPPLVAERVSKHSVSRVIHRPKAEDHYDGKDHPHVSVRTSVVGSTLVGTFGQSSAGSRQISTNDLWRDMWGAHCLSGSPVPTLCMTNLSRALKGPIVI